VTAQNAALGDPTATRERQSRPKLVIGNRNITSLMGKEQDWSRKPNDISWMLLESPRLSVVFKHC